MVGSKLFVASWLAGGGSSMGIEAIWLARGGSIWGGLLARLLAAVTVWRVLPVGSSSSMGVDAIWLAGGGSGI